MKPFKAILIPPTGEASVVSLSSLESIQEAVGGYFQNLRLINGAEMLVDEEAGIKEPKPEHNPRASITLDMEKACDYLTFAGGIRGPVLLAGSPDANGDYTDISKDWLCLFGLLNKAGGV